jgi:galactokinase
MMGGGFGGCTINLVEEGFVNEFMGLVSKAYKQKFNINLTSILVATSNGVETVNSES